MTHPWLNFRQGIKKNFLPVLFLLFLSLLFFFVMYALGIYQNSFAKQQHLLFLQGSAGSLYNNHYLAGVPSLLTSLPKSFLFFDSLLALPLLALWIGACGVYALVHYGKGVCSWIAALCAGVWLVFPFWQYIDASPDFALLSYFALIPWLIFAIIYLKYHYSIWAFAWFAIALTALFRVCDPQTFWLSLMALSFSLLFLFWEYLYHREFVSYAKFSLLIFCGVLLAILAAAEPVFSFARLLGEFTYAHDYQMHLGQMARFFQLKSNILPALVVLIFATIGTVKNYRYIVFFLFFLLFPLFAKFLPGAWLIKNPFLSYGISVTIAFTMFGVGLERVLKMRKTAWLEKGRAYFVFLILASFLFLILFLRFGYGGFASLFILLQTFSIVGFFVLLSYRRNVKNHSLFLSVIFVLIFSIFFVAGCYHRSQYPVANDSHYKSLDKSLSVDKQDYRLYPLESLFFDNRLGVEYATIGGTAAMLLRDYRLLVQNCLEFELNSDLPLNWNVVDMLAVRYVLRKDAPIKVDELAYIDYDPQTKISIYENTNYRGKLWFVSDVLVLENRQSVYKAINSTSFDPFSLALLDQQLPTQVKMPQQSSAKIISDDNDKITLRIFTDTPSFVVFSNNFCHGWYAFDKDDGVKIYRVNQILQGFYLTPGLHNISLEYIPVLENVASKLSMLFLIVLFLLLGVGLFFYLRVNYASKIIYIVK